MLRIDGVAIKRNQLRRNKTHNTSDKDLTPIAVDRATRQSHSCTEGGEAGTVSLATIAWGRGMIESQTSECERGVPSWGERRPQEENEHWCRFGDQSVHDP